MEIAVVIPALDEADQIAGAIASARVREAAPEPGSGGAVEIWVVDGGSRDATVETARAAGARVLQSERGRARQLEAGWRATHADVVVFLHADTRLETGWQEAVRAVMEDESVAGGAFRFRFDRAGAALRWIERIVALRVRLFRLPYGDQGIFVRRRVLCEVGGIAPTPVMEDLDLVRTIKRCGRLVLLPLHATTSDRRYREGGVLRTVARHVVALLAWRVGVDRERVAAWVGR